MHGFRMGWPRILRAPEGDGAGGGGAGGDAGGAGGGDGGQPAGQASGGGGGGAPYRPEGLPEHFAGADDKGTIDNLFKAFDGYRRSEAERGAVPREPAGYAFTPSEKVAPFLPEVKDDAFFGKVQARAHAAGLTDKQFGTVINGIMEELVELGAVEKPTDVNAELAALVPAEARHLDDAGQKAATQRRVQDNLAWIDGAKAQGMPADVADYLVAKLGDEALGHRAIEWLKGQAKEVRPAGEAGRGAGGVTEADYDARFKMPEADPSHAGHREWARRNTELAKQIWGTGPAARA